MPARRKMTYDRWEQLLHKAWREGLVLTAHPTRSDAALCSSSRHAHVKYTVSLDGCNCPATGDCKHLALYLFNNPDLLPLAILPIETEQAQIERILAAISA